MSWARPWLAHALRLGSLAWLVFHFTLTGLYVLPPSPLSTAAAPVLGAYVDRYFPQNWNLFAPNPLSQNLSLLVRPLTAAEAASVAARGLPESGWYDLTRPLWEQHQNPFSYAEMLGHFHIVTLQAYLYGDPAARARALVELRRLASGFVNARAPSPYAYVSVALKIRQEMDLPWPPPARARRPVRYTAVGVYPTDPTMAPAPVPAVAARP